MDNHSLEELVSLARRASAKAYAPYSQYKVGAVVVAADGQVFVGCNVENSSYGLTSCAERNALFAAQAGRAGETLEVAQIVVVEQSGLPFPPCGACRQVMLELAPDAVVFFQGPQALERVSVKDLLPHGFSLRTPEHFAEP